MLGNWKGFYQYSNEKIQKIVGYTKTDFELYIDKFDGINFSGKVKDDEKSGGMKESGEIVGKILNNKISFEKSMPKNSQIINKKGDRKVTNKKHPTIYYFGTLSEDKTEIIGNWEFRRKLGFLFVFFPVIFRPGKGTWKMNLKNIAIIFLLLILSSCDCMQSASGIIIDTKTNKPIENAEIKKIGNDYSEKSDENGFFEIRRISGGLFKCPDMKIIVSKENYITDTIEVKNGEDKLIKMIKLK